jgi:23S rRNA (cytosine1962-C5)-methyltransferase
LRDRIFDIPFYRLAHGESDGIPGLVVDRYGQILVVQFNTAGMENAREHVLRALAKVLQPEGILLRNDTTSRRLEGLAGYIETASGTVPEQVLLGEHGGQFEVPLLWGQKTGWYYDHRLNRARMLHYVKGQRVLDVFSYIGAWGLQAAVAGARQVSCIEISEPAIDYLKQNAAINQVADRIKILHGEAFERLKALTNAGEKFDMVILDPPAFIKRKKDLKQGLVAYQRLNQLAMQLLTQDGILITASCSSHLLAEVFLDTLRRAALRVERRLQILEQGHQAPDHPVHPAIPETNYLKTYFCRVLHER